MKQISLSPTWHLVPVLLGLVVGLIVGKICHLPLVGIIGGGTILLAWLCLEYNGKPAAQYFFVALVIICGYSLTQLTIPPVNLAGVSGEFSGAVITTKELAGYQRVITRLHQFPQKVCLHLPIDDRIQPGVSLAFQGSFELPSNAGNPGEFDYRKYLQGLGVRYLLATDDYQVKSESNVATLITGIKGYMKVNIESAITDPALVSSLVLGDRSLLSSDDQETWKRLGISHLLAISGMHIGLIAMVLSVVLRPLPWTQAVKAYLVAVCMVVYVFLTGGSPSAWRAWAMASLALWGRARARSVEPLNIWGLAGILLLLVDPLNLDRVGFQLSFLASGGIILWSPVISKLGNRWTGKIAQSILVSIVAQISLAPILVNHFQEVSLLAPVTTLLFLPFVMVLVMGGLLIGLCPYLTPISWLVDNINTLIFHVQDFLQPLAVVVQVHSLTLLHTGLWYGLWIYLTLKLRETPMFPRRKTRYRLIISFAVTLVFFSLPPSLFHPLEVTVIDVGQGDSIYIRTPYGQNVLVDGGGDSVYWQKRGRDVGKQRLVPYLKYRGVDELDLVILSHPHEDHLHGLLAVLDELAIKQVVDSGYPHLTASYSYFLEKISKLDIKYQRVTAGDVLRLPGGITLNFTHPREFLQNTSSDVNNNSLVFYLEYHTKRLLFTGDLDLAGQINMLRSGSIPTVDWIKVPHHGSKSAWWPELYDRLKPTYAVISVGNNSFGHPSDAVCDGLSRRGIHVYRTDQHGAVSFYVWGPWLGRFFSGLGE